jgi:hypothetical protein
MNIRALAISSLLWLAWASIAVPTYAESVAEDPLTTMARIRFKEGVDFYDKGRFDQARASFLQAYALKKHPAVLLNLAWSCLKGGHPLEAYRSFKQFLSEATDITDKARADANDGQRQALGQLGRIEIVAATTTSVTVDGIASGVTPLDGPVLVEPGAHTVALRNADAASEAQSVSVLAGDTAIVRSRRVVLAATPLPPPGAASATALPPTTNSGGPPGAPMPTSPSGEIPRSTAASSSIASAAPPARRSDSESVSFFAPPSNLVPVFLLAGLAVAAYGTATGLYVVEQSALDKASQVQSDIVTNYQSYLPNPCSVSQPPTNLALKCSALATDNDNANSDALWGNIALGVGIAATAGTLVYWIVADKHTSSTTASLPLIVPVFGHSLVGASVAGSF